MSAPPDPLSTLLHATPGSQPQGGPFCSLASDCIWLKGSPADLRGEREVGIFILPTPPMEYLILAVPVNQRSQDSQGGPFWTDLSIVVLGAADPTAPSPLGLEIGKDSVSPASVSVLSFVACLSLCTPLCK